MTKKPQQKRKKPWLWIAGACIVAAVIIILLLFPRHEPSIVAPTLTVETPQKVRLSAEKELTLNVTVSSLGEASYPAMSMSLAFDPSKLEFLGIEEGNLCIRDEQSSSGKRLPEWSCSVENSNAKGLINIMYLDMTGGKHAFSKELLQEDENVVLRLRFRLRGSVSAGDVLELNVADAVFAASDETQSLAVTTGTLKTKNSRIVIGE